MLNSNSYFTGKNLKFLKLELFQVCGSKILKVDELTFKIKLMKKNVYWQKKIVNNSYSDEEKKKS